MKTNEKSYEQYYQDCLVAFPDEALQADTSRGFALTSVKAQYVRERLNSVFGFLNWSLTGTYQRVENGVIYLGKLTVKTPHGENSQEAAGYGEIKKNIGDAFKGAQTDSLSKCASFFGIANEVFKGNVAPPKTEATSAGKSWAGKKSYTKSSNNSNQPKGGFNQAANPFNSK